MRQLSKKFYRKLRGQLMLSRKVLSAAEDCFILVRELRGGSEFWTLQNARRLLEFRPIWFKV